MAATGPAGIAAGAATIEAQITVTRVSATTWLIEFRFSRPVIGVDYGPQVDGYRTKSWKVVTLFLGFLGGDALTEDGTVDLNERFMARGRDGEVVIVPAGAKRGERVFAYLGPRQPFDAGRTRLIIDPTAPAW